MTSRSLYGIRSQVSRRVYFDMTPVKYYGSKVGTTLTTIPHTPVASQLRQRGGAVTGAAEAVDGSQSATMVTSG